MEINKYYPNKKALLMAIPLGLVTGVTAQLLSMLLAGRFPPDGWSDLTIGLIIGGLGLSRAYYHNLVSGKYAKR